MAVSQNQALRKKADTDVAKKSKGIDPGDENTEPELERIRESLIEHRDNRDTTNIPSVERSSSNDRIEALRRRMRKSRWSGGKERNGSNATAKNSSIADSGSPDGGGGDGGGDSGGGGGGGD